MDLSMIPPGSAVGLLGSGQLGRMFAIAARQMGYRVHIYSPESDTPAGQVGDIEISAPYEDLARVGEFARGVSVVTFEFENIPSLTSEAVAAKAPVRPAGEILHVTQQRLREKRFLSSGGFPVAPFREIQSLADLESAAIEIGFPLVLKTAAFGYDGKGQRRMAGAAEMRAAFAGLGGAVGVAEGWIDYDCEISVIVARGADGAVSVFPPFENSHRRHILDWTVAPARVPEAVAREADAMARAIAATLGLVGLLTIEFFCSRSGRLIVNELAPRTHNSGHLTIDAAETSQFEQQLRAVCCLPLGSPRLREAAAMANLLGDLWDANGASPDWSAALAIPGVKLHLYGKAEARPGRKMGHLTATAETPNAALTKVLEARHRLEKPQ